jgi:hypothetical protein
LIKINADRAQQASDDACFTPSGASMSRHFHAVVWIDHRDARIFTFNAAESDKLVVHAHQPQPHLHRKANSIGDGRAPGDPDYFDQVAKALDGAGEILIAGPANAKLELKKHLDEKWPAIARRIVGVENADHPSDGALLDHARRYFTAADRMRAQRG